MRTPRPVGNLTPVNFALQARAFVEAAEREFRHSGSDFSFPGYFLAGRAIELGLKVFLLLRGQSKRDLMSVSHDLVRALDAARGLGFDAVVRLRPEHEEALRMLNPYYESKDLGYPTTGFKSYPEPVAVLGCARQVLSDLDSAVRAWRLVPSSGEQ
jgi:hypothetical protein